MAQCLGLHNVWVGTMSGSHAERCSEVKQSEMCLWVPYNVWVAQCFGGTMSGWHSVWVAECLGGGMSGGGVVGGGMSENRSHLAP